MFLLKVGIFIGGEGGWWFWVSIDDCLQPQYLIGYPVLSRANPLCVHANIWANQKAAEESCKSSTNIWFLACVQSPIQCTGVINDTQDNWMWVIIDFSRCECHKGCCTEIQDDGHIFQTVDRDECLVWIIFEMQECWLNYFLREREVPIESQGELSPMMDAVGILGIKCAIGVSNLIPESGDKACEMKINSSCIVEFTR